MDGSTRTAVMTGDVLQLNVSRSHSRDFNVSIPMVRWNIHAGTTRMGFHSQHNETNPGFPGNHKRTLNRNSQ
jgi:hypothetical protein